MTSERLKKAALIIWIAVGALILGYVALVVADSVRVIWLPVAFAAGLVFLLEPAVETFERFKIHRIVATILAFILLSALIVAVLALVYPTVRAQAVELAESLPTLYVDVIDWMRETGARFGLDVDALLSQQAIEEWLNDPANQETIQQLLFGFDVIMGE